MKKPEGIRRHHLLYTRATWESQSQTASLRRNPNLIFRMHDDPHAELHKAVPTVPVLDHITAGLVAVNFEPVFANKLASVDNLLTQIDKQSTNYNATTIQRELGAVTMHAIEMQKPFIREGLIR